MLLPVAWMHPDFFDESSKEGQEEKQSAEPFKPADSVRQAARTAPRGKCHDDGFLLEVRTMRIIAGLKIFVVLHVVSYDSSYFDVVIFNNYYCSNILLIVLLHYSCPTIKRIFE